VLTTASPYTGTVAAPLLSHADCFTLHQVLSRLRSSGVEGEALLHTDKVVGVASGRDWASPDTRCAVKSLKTDGWLPMLFNGRVGGVEGEALLHMDEVVGVASGRDWAPPDTRCAVKSLKPDGWLPMLFNGPGEEDIPTPLPFPSVSACDSSCRYQSSVVVSTAVGRRTDFRRETMFGNGGGRSANLTH